MAFSYYILYIILIYLHSYLLLLTEGKIFIDEPDEVRPNLNMTAFRIQLKDIIKHLKSKDPVGIPGAPVPDPMPTPDMVYATFTTFILKKNKIIGLSKFRIKAMETDLTNMQVDLVLTYDKLEVLGKYTVGTFFRSKEETYNVTVLDVTMGGLIRLSMARNGILQASKIDMDLTFKDIRMFFNNPDIMLRTFQDLMNNVGVFIFNQVKPFVLKEVNSNVKSDLNKMLSSMKRPFPDSIPPLDLFVAEGRKYAREKGFDPLPVEDYKYTTGLLTVDVTNISLSGLSSFYRTGNVTVSIKNRTIALDSHVATQMLEGKCTWKTSMGQFASSYGTTGFTVQFVQVRTKFNQSFDLSHKPNLDLIDVKLGNVQLSMNGLGTIDYILEFLANVFPNVLRFEIVDGIEEILRQRIQTVLGALDVEQLVEKQLVDNLVTAFNDNQTVTVFDDSSEIEVMKGLSSDIDAFYDDLF